MSTEIKVPDIGDFKDVPVIEVHVKPGQVVKAEDTLITLESDKATMDVPAPGGGTVESVAVKVGDRVGQGMLILTYAGGASAAAPAAKGGAIATDAAFAAASGNAYDVVVLGAGPGGYSAAFRAADLGKKVALIE